MYLNKNALSCRRRPLLLVGVLELPSSTSEHTLQLRDGTGAVACVVTETSEEEDECQRAAFNTAWIGTKKYHTEVEGHFIAPSLPIRRVCVCVFLCDPGCLVCVQQFTMVTERFLQSNFPSYQHLDQDKFITHKHCRYTHTHSQTFFYFY